MHASFYFSNVDCESFSLNFSIGHPVQMFYKTVAEEYKLIWYIDVFFDVIFNFMITESLFTNCLLSFLKCQI